MSRHSQLLAPLAMVGILVVADLLLPDLGASLAWSATVSVLAFFLAAFAGGWLARRPFVLPALVVWAVVWLVVGYLLYRIAGPVGQASLSAMVEANWLSLLLSGVATAAGAAAGRLLGARQARDFPEGTEHRA